MTETKKRSKVVTVLLVLAVLLGIFLIVVAMQPAEYSVSRTATIAAPQAAIFPHVNEPKKWEAWNPWGKIDPAMKLTYDGPTSGVGASYSWEGNNEVGAGKMTITESKPAELVHFHMDFFKPMAGTAEADFTFKPEGDKTSVTWSMSGKNNFISKAFCMFMNMDKMIGGSFEKGLADLKNVVETEAKK